MAFYHDEAGHDSQEQVAFDADHDQGAQAFPTKAASPLVMVQQTPGQPPEVEGVAVQGLPSAVVAEQRALAGAVALQEGRAAYRHPDGLCIAHTANASSSVSLPHPRVGMLSSPEAHSTAGW